LSNAQVRQIIRRALDEAGSPAYAGVTTGQ
ncbi:MAG: hypothetical protein QOD74_1168, partial [Variibacter sp.]|nr:hypothetical protein [Variibacter sp.]